MRMKIISILTNEKEVIPIFVCVDIFKKIIIFSGSYYFSTITNENASN